MHMEPRGMAPFSPSHRGPPPAAWNNNFRPPPVHHLGPPPAAWNNNFRPPGPPPYNHLGPPPQWVPRPFPPSQESHDLGNNRFGGRGRHNNTAPQFSHYGRQNSNWSGNTYRDSGRGRSRGRGGFGRDGGTRPMESGGNPFYSNSMAEDPWKHIKPLLWKSCSDSSSSNSTGQAWLPNSVAQKKPVISEASHKPSSNQQSLAEYLAASLDEATCDEPSNWSGQIQAFGVPSRCQIDHWWFVRNRYCSMAGVHILNEAQQRDDYHLGVAILE